MASASRAGVLFQTADTQQYSGKIFRLHNRNLLNFSCCSYMGLELRDDLKLGAVTAMQLYGTQFPFPRAMMQSPLYEELHSLLEQMTGGNVIIAPSTTLAHVSGIPVLVGPNDAVVLDVSAHASLHTAAALLRGIPIEALRHNRMDLLERKLRKLSDQYDRVWYLADGLYSIHGDFAPIQDLCDLQERFPKLWLYIDDAHSTSWTGKHGRGYALDKIGDRSRAVVALSLNKAFAAGGGALVLPNQELAARVGLAGGPMVFSGAVQPALLGAAVASARLHLSPEFASMQNDLKLRLDHTLALAHQLEIPMSNLARSPIFFVPCGPTDRCFALVRAMQERGIGVCATAFPIVPRNRSGIRFTITLHNALEDITLLMEGLKEVADSLGIVGLVGRTQTDAANGD